MFADKERQCEVRAKPLSPDVEGLSLGGEAGSAQGEEGRSRTATRPPRREWAPHLWEHTSKASLWKVWGVAWDELTLEFWLSLCAKECAKCKELRDVSDFVPAPRSPHLGVGRPKLNNLRQT